MGEPAHRPLRLPGEPSVVRGHLPAFREEIARRLTGHDVLVAIGAPVFTYHAEGHGPYVPEGLTVFQITEDPEMAAAALAGRSLLASIGPTVAELLVAPRDGGPAAQRGRAAPPVLAGNDADRARVRDADARSRAAEGLHRRRGSAEHSRRHAVVPADHRQRDVLHLLERRAGHGLPAAVGVALGKPDRKVIALLGDGSAMYSIQGLWTAAQLRLPICFVIVNNRRYEALQHFARRFDLKQAVGTDLGGIDFVAVARSMGCEGVRVEEGASRGCRT